MKTLTYFEIFCFVLFFGVFILRSIVMQIRGVKVFVIARGKKPKEKILEMLFMPVFFSWAVLLAVLIFSKDTEGLPAWIAAPLFHSLLTNGLAMVLLPVALILFVSAIVSFGDSWRVGIDDRNPGTLIDSGIFAFSRNPIFLSIDLYMIGTALLHSSWFFLALAVIVPPGIHIQILNEERFLFSIYGQDYSGYRQKTPRYLIF
jgi:protein-S-isoprenylcysteine O-methyltransferase Ste14